MNNYSFNELHATPWLRGAAVSAGTDNRAGGVMAADLDRALAGRYLAIAGGERSIGAAIAGTAATYGASLALAGRTCGQPDGRAAVLPQ